MKFVYLLILLFLLFVVDLFSGITALSLSDFLDAFSNYDSTNTQHLIARDLRFPRVLVAILAGSCLSVSGLLMQTIFNNPLAEPNILGVSTGASLFVAITMLLGWHFFSSNLGIVFSALCGAFLFGLILLFVARFVRSHLSLLLVGIMLASFAGSLISILHVWADAHRLKSFTLWSMGSLQHISFEQISFISFICLVGLSVSLFFVRSLNALLLGQENAHQLGIHIVRVRIGVIFVASFLTGIITAFCGPIAFVGMAVPNGVRLLFRTSDHMTLLLGSILFGSCFMLACDSIIQWISPIITLPINVITSLIGTPFMLFIILKKWS